MTSITASYFSSHAAYQPAGLMTRLRSALATQAQRRRLSELDDHLLADLGLSRRQAMTEAQRPLWDITHRGYC